MIKETDTSADFNLLLPDSWLVVEDDRTCDRGLASLSRYCR